MATMEFKDVESMAPLTDGRSLYSIRICGKLLAYHILKSIKDKVNPCDLQVKISDTMLKGERETIELIKEFANITDAKSKTAFEGNRYWVSSEESILIRYPWSLLEVMEIILGHQKPHISQTATIEKKVTLEGNVHIGDGTKICQNATLKGDIYVGENSLIGNNSFIRGPCSIGRNCTIGYTTELKNALINDNNLIGPLNFVADSVIGSGCLIGALVRTSNYRLDRETIKVKIGEEYIDSRMDKLGAFVGDNVQMGIGVIILPGRKISSNACIGPKIIVTRNLEGGKRYMLKQELETQAIWGEASES